MVRWCETDLAAWSGSGRLTLQHGQVVDGVESGPVVALSDPEASDVGRQGQGEVGAAVHTTLDDVEGVVLRELTVYLGKHTMRITHPETTQCVAFVSSPSVEYPPPPPRPPPTPSSWRDPVKLTAR